MKLEGYKAEESIVWERGGDLAPQSYCRRRLTSQDTIKCGIQSLPHFLPNQVTFSINDATTLADLLALQLHRVEDDVRDIVDKAVKELGTEKVPSRDVSS